MWNRIFRISLLVLLLCTGALSSRAQRLRDVDLHSPFDFDILLSASYAELRSNHFHAGLDFKTGGVVGKPISCVADGYIYRAKVEAAGYGRCV